MPDSNNSRMQEVVDRLLQNTVSGAQRWEPHSTNPSFFQTRIGDKYLVSVSSRDSDGAHPYVAKLWRRKQTGEDETSWETIEQTTTTDQFSQLLSGGPPSPLASLWQAARRQALGLDDAFDDVLRELDAKNAG